MADSMLSNESGASGVSKPEFPPVWQPTSIIASENVRVVAARIEQAKIRRIISARATATRGVVFQLLMTFYRRYLKSSPVVRGTVIFLWRYGYPFYLRSINFAITFIAMLAGLGNAHERRWRSLVMLNDFVVNNKLESYELVAKQRVVVPVPGVFPVCEKNFLESADASYEFPAISIAVLTQATCSGGTNMVLADENIICHDLFDPLRDSTSEELHGRALIGSRQRVRWLMSDKEPESVEEAAVFIDACAGNYAHWITEVLPRLALFCEAERYKDVPIIINDGLHKNIMDSMVLVAGVEREIITLAVGRAMRVEKLYVTSVTGYVPFDRRKKNKFDDHSHGKFSPQALSAVRAYMDKPEYKFEADNWPEKIFLRRNSDTRKLTNTDEIESLLVAKGYVLVEPEKLSYIEQVQLFKHARKIFSPTGAALANAIFCQPGASVAVIMGIHEDMIYRYWLNMLAPLGVNVSYALGSIVKHKNLGIHGDFYVAEDELADLLDVMENES